MAIKPIVPIMVFSGTRAVGWVLSGGDTGDAFKMPKHADKTVQVFGAAGVGGSITMRGSNDPRVETDLANAVWFPLTNPQGDPITNLTFGGVTIMENPLWISPIATGDGATLLNINLNING